MIPLFGIGFDIHKLVDGRPLILAGAKVPFRFGLLGDSDADVVCHSLIDALLGATGKGDIGSYFGIGKPDLMGAVSLKMLEDVVQHLEKSGYTIANVDTTIIAEEPKLGVFRDNMVNNLKRVLGTDKVSVKFTTPKGIGSLGNSEAIACMAVACVTASE